MNIISLIRGNQKNTTEEAFLQNRAPIRSIPSTLSTIVQRKTKGNHIYIEAGQGKPVIFCHGLFGGLFNIDKTCAAIAAKYRFLMPYLPMYDMALKDCTVRNLGNYLESFINDLHLEEAIVIGSSMGGGASLYYACRPGNKLKGLVLCGSSGLSNIPLSKGYFKRRNYDFVKEATRDIFYNRTIPPDEMVRDVFNALESTDTVLRSIRFTKSATNEKLHHELAGIKIPALLVWGKQDPITPVEAADLFHELMPDTTLHIIDECGHVPTQEKPDIFLNHFFAFMKKTGY